MKWMTWAVLVLVAAMPAMGEDSKPVTGAAWVNRKTGASDVLRGLRVHLLKPEVARDAVVKGIREGVGARRALAASRLKQAAAAKVAAEDAGSPPRYDFAKKDSLNAMAARLEDEVKRLETGAKECEGEIDKLGETIQTGKAFLLVRASHPVLTDPDLSELVSAAEAGTTTTDVDGRYQLRGVPGDGGFLYAKFTSDYGSLEWLKKVSPGDKLDLFNDTATRQTAPQK